MQLFERPAEHVIPEMTTGDYELNRPEELEVGEKCEYRGALIEKVHVWDESEKSVTLDETQQTLTYWDEILKDNPNIKAPSFNKYTHVLESTNNNEMADKFYCDPSVIEWGSMMPTAIALYYLTHLDEKVLPSGRVVSDAMRRFATDTTDAIGIRTRKRVASEIVSGILDSTSGEANCLSLACGAADLMLETTASRPAHLTLVDIDEKAFELAKTIATGLGIGEDRYHPLNRNLLTTMVRANGKNGDSSLVNEIGEESQKIVEAIGIVEYFSDRTAKSFVRNAYRCVEPGGSLIVANMLKSRPHKEVNERVIGWPKLHMRSVDDIIDMLAETGIDSKNVEITIPQDGVYAVINIKKPLNEVPPNAN